MLPDEVRKAVEYVDQIFDGADNGEWATIKAHLLAREAEVKVLRVKCAGSLANNLCPDHRDKQSGKSCLACTIERTEKRAERAEALLLELRLRINETRGPNAFDVVQRVDAHLSENSRG